MQKKLWKIPSFLALDFDKVAELLIQKGAVVNFAGQGGDTPFTWAALKGKTKTVFYCWVQVAHTVKRWNQQN